SLPIRSLLERLAELEQATAEPDLRRTRVRYRRRRSAGECVLLSFGATCIAGGFALGAAGLANSQVTYRKPPGTTTQSHASGNHDTLTIEKLLARDEMPEGRRVWWKVPRWRR